MSLSPNYAKEVGDWLTGLSSWDVWLTVTSREPRSLPAWRRGLTRYIDKVEATSSFWGVEHGSRHGRLHAHALLGWDAKEAQQLGPEWSGILGWEEDREPGRGNDLVMPSIRELWRLAYTRFGRSHVDRYDPNQGAGHYVSKYVSKQLTDWDFHAHHR